MTDLIFLKSLREKLKGGNLRSIHLNVLPGRYATRLDLGNLNLILPDLGQKFLDLLFNNYCFEFKITFDGIDLNSLPQEDQKKLGLLSKRLNSLNIENEDNFKEHGIKTFGFGYPLLIKPTKQDPTKIIKAPILIWPLEFIKATNKVNTWSVLRNKTINEKGKVVDEEIHSITLNEVLLSHLKTDENIIIPQINEELLEDSVIDRKELIEVCCNVLKSLNAETNTSLIESFHSKLNEPISNSPDSGSFENMTGNIPWIHFGGIFGLFRTQKESIITDLDKIISNYSKYRFENLKIDKFPGTSQSSIETDPSQQEILSTLGIEPKKIIQGPPGTGKSQSLTALITNALANNLKCLVVCEKKTALDVIKKNLHKENDQLGALAALVEDINKDRDNIVNSVRDRMLCLTQNISFNQSTYSNLIEALELKIDELNKQHQLLDKKLYQGKSWTELVGEYLRRQKIADNSILKSKLDYKQFRFQKDEKELAVICSKINQAKKHYDEIRGLEHPLELLNNNIFSDDNHRGLQLKLEDLSKNLIGNLNNTKTALDEQIIQYKNWLDLHYSTYYESILEQINSYQNFIKENENSFGSLIYKNDKFTQFYTKIFKAFSKKYKIIYNSRILIVTQILKIRKTQQTFDYFEHKFIKDDNLPDLKVYPENINSLVVNVNEWYKANEQAKQNYVEGFSSSSLHPQYNDKETIRSIEDLYDSYINQLKEIPLLKRPISEQNTHYNKITELKSLIEELSIIHNNLENNFREYFEWRKFYIALTPLEKTVVTSIIETNCENWVAAFESWYYFWLLTLLEINLKGIPKSDDVIKEIIDLKQQLKKVQTKRILNNWSLKQYISVKKAHSVGLNPISLFNKRGSRGERRNSLRKILSTDLDLFSDFFPVLMVSPTVCSSIVPLKEGLFDIILFDEASQLRLEDTFPALIRGKIKIISGDIQQMPPSNFFMGGNAILNPTEEDYEEEQGLITREQENTRHRINNSLELAESESLLVYAENCNYKQSYLKVHYRSQHPQLIDFSNHAFYGKRLIPMPPKQDYIPIQFIDVKGIYEDQVNRDEARQVVDILQNSIKPFKKGHYPSVGIATFNIYQRNLIIEEITKARQQKSDFDKKISDLGSDFFVKNLENIQGDERDIIIISTTFGRRPDGTFRQQFGPILQRNGYKLLNVIITRAKYKVYVCTSVPTDYINQYSLLLPQFKNTGRAIYYAYLAYAKSVSEKNFEIKESILKQLYENCESRSFEIDSEADGSESPFEEEVYYRLAEKIGQDRLIQQYKIGGFRIDMVVNSKITKSPIIAIECDGAKYHSSNEAYSWDMFRQSRLEDQGFVFYRIWSTNWWYSEEKELKKLLSFISFIDRNEKPIVINEHLAEVLKTAEIVPITKQEESRKRVNTTSLVLIKNPEGKILKVRFTDQESLQIIKPDNHGIITVYQRSPLARAIIGRFEGDICQVGMLELYYEIVKID